MKKHHQRAILVCVLLIIAGQALAAPYPASTYIKSIRFDWTTHKRLAPGSDNWPVTWADDDNQYTTFGDGNGFNGTSKQAHGICRISGDWKTYTCADLSYQSDENYKSYGIISIKGVLYFWVRQATPMLAKSTDHGKSWTTQNWTFPGWGNMGAVSTGTFLQFGRDYEGARDNYVYSYLYNKSGGRCEIQTGGEMVLARCHKDKILTEGAYEWFSGMAGTTPSWSSNINDRKPVFKDPNGIGWCQSAIYNAGLKRYILMTEHATTHNGELGVFDAPEPWGPWTTVYYGRWRTSDPGHTAFFWNFSNKWTSSDGKTTTMIFTGNNENDSWNTLQCEFELFGATPIAENFSIKKQEPITANGHGSIIILPANENRSSLLSKVIIPVNLHGRTFRTFRSAHDKSTHIIVTK